MNEHLIHQYPPELMALLINAIPRLIRGKKDVIGFFKGCGVSASLYADLQQIVTRDRQSITKYEIVRKVLERINDKGDVALRQRREILKRVTQWEDFSTCYDNNRMEAKGYVAAIQNIVNVKDSFTRINQQREKAEQENRKKHEAEITEKQRVKAERNQIKTDLFALFHETNAKERGIALEGVLNRLFKSHGISIRESFRRVGNDGEGVVEQIDGVIVLDGDLYLVEMKWWSKPLGTGEVAQHLVRVFNRGAARGILISHSGYTDPAITTCRESLANRVFVLAKLEEIVLLLERDESLPELLRTKVHMAIAEKNPLVEPLLDNKS